MMDFDFLGRFCLPIECDFTPLARFLLFIFQTIISYSYGILFIPVFSKI